MNFSMQSAYNWYRNLLRNPKYRWWVVLATVLYFVSPIDILPDVIPFIGEIDDVFLVTLLVSEVSQLVIERFKARQGSTDTEPTATGDGSTTKAGTVDVDAVVVK